MKLVWFGLCLLCLAPLAAWADPQVAARFEAYVNDDATLKFELLEETVKDNDGETYKKKTFVVQCTKGCKSDKPYQEDADHGLMGLYEITDRCPLVVTTWMEVTMPSVEIFGVRKGKPVLLMTDAGKQGLNIYADAKCCPVVEATNSERSKTIWRWNGQKYIKASK